MKIAMENDKQNKSHQGTKQPGPEANAHEYPSTAKGLTIIIAIMTSMFLVSLDRTIIATAIPYITDEFDPETPSASAQQELINTDSIKDIAWYGSAYLLPNSSLQLLFGKIYKFHNTRSIFLSSILLFEIGSAVCGAAPSSTALTIGRAIAGAGSAGVMSGVMQILVFVAPLEKRPVYAGLIASVSAIASVVSPLLAGAFTENVSWRWCFYINLPIAGVAVVAVWVLVRIPSPAGSGLSFKEKVGQLDLLGLVVFVPCIVCLVFALQWGGSTYTWDDGRIIALLVVFGVTLLTWLTIQYIKKEYATVPGRIFFQRNILSGIGFATATMSAMTLLVYYIPTWFQAVKGDSPVNAGLSFIPFLFSLVIASTLGGLVTSKLGYYNPTMLLSCIIAPIGVGLLTAKFSPNTTHPTWIGLQVLCGLGIGLGQQQSIIAVQAVLPPADIPIGMALVFFGQQLGGTIFLSVAETVFSESLLSGLNGIRGLGAGTAASIASAGATEFRHLVPPGLMPEVLDVYSRAITMTWYIALGTICFGVVPAVCMEWREIKSKKRVDKGGKVAATGDGSEHKKKPDVERDCLSVQYTAPSICNKFK
ncbi:MFS multidrug transporter [Penicillium argentinense]|uniref:MFS multidrug transporter n=1 Tax=Penicillium argentinense TaxID=1131581 RepID=A0A9W9G1Y3_9EURO|nr:MFS multidrug transporter [Penicillium argentinense]KAJ5110577.1 MFS multidrug transporter [Penicillium argentinense]